MMMPMRGRKEGSNIGEKVERGDQGRNSNAGFKILIDFLIKFSILGISAVFRAQSIRW